MSQADLGLLEEGQRSNFIRLRTLIILRWVAIVGQLTAISVARELYDLQLELGLCYLAVGVSVVGNLVAMFVFPEDKRLSEAENFLMVMFDLLQLCLLLFLTGGLHNPFSLLVLAPATVSAAVLSLRSTILLNVTALALITVMVFAHLPLRTTDGEILALPQVFVFGQWTALAIALAFISVYARRATKEMNAMSDALIATQMALARAQKLSDLGGVVAAAAHELGTPLATIKLASSELIDDLDALPDLQDDARLIRAQADRCRDILRGMGRAGKDDLHLRQAPLSELLREAAEPHENRGKHITMDFAPLPGGGAQPLVLRRPDILHGLRNLIQNAVDFARSEVWIDAGWDGSRVLVRIRDDGPGYPPHLIRRLGDPLLRRRRSAADRGARPEYEGMGLGLFIAKTLLERSGAELSFANGAAPSGREGEAGTPHGAIVEVTWPALSIVPPETAHTPLGENPLIET
ncbi:histidine kinase [Salipiger aestuarii]|uniref:histidine kinase n=1 Tax=Salipiger aestuarii TaxID=568098 RepID=A0A327YKL4_9RHOB|nr:ActS/PrrB/RegB family redox-sensitive histidine kinase [Salipiger aestuarii]EIE50116.1 sensor histidine kinase RegB [Citreicella sp. 357]KAA8609903.1 histidine kinase [Salipiger aestuarii]KAA8616215.1 histidine kinase [Salipiger aestuarii]KAB2543161.1 histidine kinase [Salipiger aestuarii]RAK21483.1 two-component system sensor histidine kinase RegB [Salipiger aestuarii]